MSYSNGRIYTETVGGQQVGVSIYDVQRAVPVTLRRTVNGVVERKSSSDLGVLVAAKAGETIPASDGKGNWTVDRRTEINPWARYKPIPCLLQAGHNVPRMLTEKERTAERYGLNELMDNFTDDEDWQYENYANSLDTNNPYGGVSMRSWAVGMYRRLTDFVKSNNSGGSVNNKGYDHKARPTGVVVTYGGVQHKLKPLIHADKRNIIIPAGSTDAVFQFPNDREWIATYLDFVTNPSHFHDDQTDPNRHIKSEMEYVDINDEWLSPIDLITSNTASQLLNTSTLRRGIAIYYWFEQGDIAKWKLKGIVWSYYQNDGQTYEQDFDLTDESDTIVTHDYNCNLRTIEGSFLVAEFWTGLYGQGEREYYPILGLAYEITITRTGTATGPVDIDGVITWLYIDTSGLIHFSVIASELGNGIKRMLKNHYTRLAAYVVGLDNPINLLDDGLTFTVGESGDWRDCTVQVYHPLGTTATLECTKVGGGTGRQTLEEQ